MKLIDEARAILAAAHKVMPPDLIAAHAVELAGVVASQDLVIAGLCQIVENLTGTKPEFVPVEDSWPAVFSAGFAHE